MPTANDLIVSAAKKLGVREDEITAEDANDGLDVLNSMLDIWQTQRIFVYQIKQASLTWPAATSSRTIGSGGNFNTTRPVRIERGTFFRDSGSNDYQVEVTHDREKYDAIRLKSNSGSYPELLFYDTSYATGTLYVYPVPSSQLTLFLNSWQTLQEFATLTDNLSLPPGYRYAIEHNLAVELESVFRVPCPASVKEKADKSRGYIASMNSVEMSASTDLAAVFGQSGMSRDIYNDGR